MNVFSNMKIAKKISAGYGVILTLMAVISLVVYLSISSIIEASRWVNHTYEVIRIAKTVGAAMVDMETGQRGFMIVGKDEYLVPFNNGNKTFDRMIAKGQQLTSDNPAQGKRWKEVDKLHAQWMTETAKPEIAARRQLGSFANFEDISSMVEAGKGKFYMDIIRGVLKDIIDAEEVLIKVRGDEQISTSSFAKTFSVLGSLFALVFGVLVAKIISSSITRPLRMVVTRAKEIASGDLTGSTIQAVGDDELAELTHAINEMNVNLNDIIHSVSNSSQALSSAALQLQSSALQTSQGMESQQDETEQVATAMNQMSETVKEVSRNAGLAATSAADADKASAKGYSLVSQNMAGINQLAQSIGTTSEAINQLGEDTNSVDNIVEVISGIADQTNLLALNAAIEAARAGEQGRGFAVVADEVRTLASRTQKSTEEIRSMLNRLKTGAKDAVQAMDEGQQQAKSSVEQAKNASDAITEITRVVTEISEMNSLIATASEEQRIVTEEINRNVVKISTESHSTLQNSLETTAAAEKISGLSSQMQQIVSRFSF
jgi:methyl-accepting chemotaxis protein